MIFLTGDVHHESLATRDQACLEGTEVAAARKYVEIAASYDVPVTLFVSGKTVRESPDAVRALADRDGVELGGHNWSCFERSALHYLSELLLGTHYGPERYQRWDVRKTLAALEDATGERPRTWRSHGFIADDRTPPVLADAGVEVVSNDVGPDAPLRRVGPDADRRGGPDANAAGSLLSLPINTLPDHGHVYHGWLSEAYVRRQNRIRRAGPAELLRLGRAPTRDELVRAGKETAKLLTGSRRRSSFENRWYGADEWVETVESQVRERLDEAGFATVLAHPACMEIADGMDAFERLCAFASDFETGVVSGAGGLA